MNTTNWVQIALELWTAFFLLVSLVPVISSRKNDPPRAKAVSYILCFGIVLLINDAIAIGFRGNTSQLGFFAVRISNFLVFLTSPLISVSTAGMIIACVGDTTPEIRWIRRVLHSLTLLYVLFLLVSCFTGIAYYFDSNNFYHRGPAYFVCTVFGVAMLLDLLYLTIRYRRYLSRFVRISVFSSILLPSVSILVQTRYYGLSLNNIAISMSSILLVMAYLVESGRRLSEREIELMENRALLAEQKNRIALSQIQPHFIFNVLGSIEQLCRTDASRAEMATHRFARYLRANINTMGSSALVPFSEELQLVENYLWLEKMRFGDDVQYSDSIGPQSFLVPRMSVQPLVENAVKHGMRADEDCPLHIFLRTEETPTAYVITVSDDGCGFDPEQLLHDGKDHIGIANVRQRLAALSGGNLEINTKLAVGTTVTVTLPKPEQAAETGEEKNL